MSDYNDGSSFGYDIVRPYDYVPITFEQISLPGGRNFLASPNEYPKMSAIQPVEVAAPVTDASLVKKVQTPPGMVEGFRARWHPDDIQFVLIFIVLVVGILQIKMMMTIDFMMKMQFMTSQTLLKPQQF